MDYNPTANYMYPYHLLKLCELSQWPTFMNGIWVICQTKFFFSTWNASLYNSTNLDHVGTQLLCDYFSTPTRLRQRRIHILPRNTTWSIFKSIFLFTWCSSFVILSDSHFLHMSVYTVTRSSVLLASPSTVLFLIVETNERGRRGERKSGGDDQRSGSQSDEEEAHWQALQILVARLFLGDLSRRW